MDGSSPSLEHTTQARSLLWAIIATRFAFRFFQIFVALPKGYAVAVPRAYMQLIAWTEVFALRHPSKDDLTFWKASLTCLRYLFVNRYVPLRDLRLGARTRGSET